MIRSLTAAAEIAGEVETRARIRAEHQMRRVAMKVAAGAIGIGGLTFLSVGFILAMAPSWGAGIASLVVALIWLLIAVGILIALMMDEKKGRPPLVPPKAQEHAMGALAADFGKNSPIITGAALLAGIMAGRAR